MEMNERKTLATTVGERIKQRREELKWSQRELSKRMGYQSHSTITKIEAGSVDMPQSRIVQFAEILGVSVADLMNSSVCAMKNEEGTNVNLKQLRTMLRMTQKQFGEYFGIPHRTIQNWEYGKNKCPEYLYNLMKYKLKKESLIK